MALSSWADLTAGWVSDSVTHAGVGFRSSTATYGGLSLIATSYLANYQEAQTYLKFLPLLHDLPKQPFYIVYDAEADVLYIDFNNPLQSAEDSELIDDDIVMRYDDDEAIVGLTILNASQR